MVNLGSIPSSLINHIPGRVAGLETAVGMAYSGYTMRVLREHPGISDFVEIPFEQFANDEDAIRVLDEVPVVLHCASLSLASMEEPAAAIIDSVKHRIEQTGTPWLGEHLAFIREGQYNVGFTMSPQFNREVLDRVVAATQKMSHQLNCPILLENGPVYFPLPGSTMSQWDFLGTLCSRLESAYLLVDLSHLLITCRNTGANAHAVLEMLPLDRVIEVHLSGLREECGVWWDDHSQAVPDEEFELLARLLRATRPRAITIEYNWDKDFPLDVLRRDFGRVRELLGSA